MEDSGLIYLSQCFRTVQAYIDMKTGCGESKWPAFLVVIQQLLIWVQFFRITKSVQFLGQGGMIQLQESIQMFIPELVECWWSKKVDKVHSRIGIFHVLEINQNQPLSYTIFVFADMMLSCVIWNQKGVIFKFGTCRERCSCAHHCGSRHWIHAQLVQLHHQSFQT